MKASPFIRTALAALLAASLPSTTLAGRSQAQIHRRDTSNVLKDQGLPTINYPNPEYPQPNYHWPGLPHYGGTPKKHIIPQTANTTKFAVNGTGLPFVQFDIGESYAGTLPISAEKDVAELFFWFFPTDNAAADDEILIWLNGGPGCSSLNGFLQENGVFQWQYGTYLPVQNPWTWVNLTNVVWVEYPAPVGFSSLNSSPKPKNEVEAAAQFLGFWKTFMETFDLKGRKVYLTGESYAGAYVPYIADAMYNQSNKEYYNVESILISDPTTTYRVVQQDIPAAAYMRYWSNLLSLNSSTMDLVNKRADKCGYTAFMDEAMVFPPKLHPLPTPPDPYGANPDCRTYTDVFRAAIEKNACFSEYNIATICPVLWDPLGFPGAFPYEAAPWVYFDRADVQDALNVKRQNWVECESVVLGHDSSPPSGLSVLPGVIEKNKKTVIVHGLLDMELLINGTIMMIQNMTFSGAQGFSKGPEDWKDFYVPFHSSLNIGTLAGAGTYGKWHTERGLTFSTVEQSGHMVPQYAPSASYRVLEFLLDRIPDLSDQSPFTTQTQPGSYNDA